MIDGVPVAADQLVFPMPASLPMGCSWSLYFAQAVSEHLMSEIPLLAQSTLLRDRGLPLVIRSFAQDGEKHEKGPDLPAGDPCHYVDVDNLGAMSTSQELVTEALDQIKHTFEARGLVLHPGEVECDRIDALGCRLSGTKRRASLKPLRFWRLRQGIRYLLGPVGELLKWFWGIVPIVHFSTARFWGFSAALISSCGSPMTLGLRCGRLCDRSYRPFWAPFHCATLTGRGSGTPWSPPQMLPLAVSAYVPDSFPKTSWAALGGFPNGNDSGGARLWVHGPRRAL